MANLYELLERESYSFFVNKEFSFKGESVGFLRGPADDDNQFLVFESGNKKTKIRWDINNGNGPSIINPELHFFYLVNDEH